MNAFLLLGLPVVVLVLVSLVAATVGNKKLSAVAAVAAGFGPVMSFFSWLKSGGGNSTGPEDQALWFGLALVFAYLIVRSHEEDKLAVARPILLILGALAAVLHIVLYKLWVSA